MAKSEDKKNEALPFGDAMTIDASKIESPVLRRLLEEVRRDAKAGIQAYDRMHNRHNRS